TIHTLHSELLTFGESFGCAECSFRLSLRPELLESLRELIAAGPDAIAEAGGDAVRPSAQTTAVHLVEAAGEAGTLRARAVTSPHQEWGLGGGIVSTAAPAA